MTSLLELLLPSRCAGCGRHEHELCARCRAGLHRLRDPLCARCGAPVAWPVERCRECAGRRLAFARARAAVAYEGAACSLVAAWKEQGRRRLAQVAAGIVAEVVPRPRVDDLTFVPAAPERALWRGHNPAASLARALSSIWGVRLVELLARGASARRQRGLPLGERRANVAGAFAAVAAVPRAVVLVDDVYTSGATAASAAAALRRSGARHVEVVTFARALRER